jgi:hypothetical protein
MASGQVGASSGNIYKGIRRTRQDGMWLWRGRSDHRCLCYMTGSKALGPMFAGWLLLDARIPIGLKSVGWAATREPGKGAYFFEASRSEEIAFQVVLMNLHIHVGLHCVVLDAMLLSH